MADSDNKAAPPKDKLGATAARLLDEALALRQLADTLSERRLRRLSDIVGTVVRSGVEPAPDEAPPAPAVFIHIPKTAGSTVGTGLQLLHGPRYVQGGNFYIRVRDGRLVRGGVIEGNPRRIARRAADLAPRFENAAVIQTHLPLALREIVPAHSRFFTFLRSPVERTVSHFSYFRSRTAAAADAAHAQRLLGLTLAGCVEERGRDPEAALLAPDNLQTRMLSGFDLDAPASREMLDAAKRNLASFDVAGIRERLDESLALLHLTYGWRMMLTYDKKVSPGEPRTAENLPPEELDAARRLNELDQELYDEALARFERTVQEWGDTLAVEVEACRRARELMVGLHTAARQADEEPRAALVEERARAIAAETTVAALMEHLETETNDSSRLAARAAAVEETARRLVSRLSKPPKRAKPAKAAKPATR